MQSAGKSTLHGRKATCEIAGDQTSEIQKQKQVTETRKLEIRTVAPRHRHVHKSDLEHFLAPAPFKPAWRYFWKPVWAALRRTTRALSGNMAGFASGARKKATMYDFPPPQCISKTISTKKKWSSFFCYSKLDFDCRSRLWSTAWSRRCSRSWSWIRGHL